MKWTRYAAFWLAFMVSQTLFVEKTIGQSLEEKRPRAEWLNEKATATAIKKVEGKLSEAEKDFREEEAKLEARLAQETAENKKAELKEKLEELKLKFQEERDRLTLTLFSLSVLPDEKPTRDVNSQLNLGMCGNLAHLIGGDVRRTIEAHGVPQNCEYYHSKRFSLYLRNASPELQSSGCFRPISGTFEFEAPSVLVLFYWNSKKAGGPPIYVYVDMPVVATYSQSSGGFNEYLRDQVLLDICPPRQPQRHLPQLGNWVQLNFSADPLTDYDSIMSNLFGGIGGGGRHRAGFEGMEQSVSAQRSDKFEIRNVVFDAELLKLAAGIREPWAEIEGVVLPKLIPQKKRLDAAKEVERKLKELLERGPESWTESLKELFLYCETYDGLSRENFVDYASDLRKSEKKLESGELKDAKKTLGKLLDKIGKHKEKFEKEMKPLGDPFALIISLFGAKEFVLAGREMDNLIKPLSEAEREGLKAAVELYRALVPKIQDYIEKQKTVWARSLNSGELLEPIRVAAGEELVFHVSATGGNYDFERNAPRWKVILWKSFVPPRPDGTVDKNTRAIAVEAGLFDIEEFRNKGFDTVVVENHPNAPSIIAAVKGRIKGHEVVIELQEFQSREGVTRAEMPISVLQEKYGLRWFSLVFPKKNEESLIPSDPEEFLTTFYFDSDSQRITAFSLHFASKNKIQWNPPAGTDLEPMEFAYFLHPGLYRYKIAVVDVLEEDPFKRIIETPLPGFRILYPER